LQLPESIVQEPKKKGKGKLRFVAVFLCQFINLTLVRSGGSPDLEQWTSASHFTTTEEIHICISYWLETPPYYPHLFLAQSPLLGANTFPANGRLGVSIDAGAWLCTWILDPDIFPPHPLTDQLPCHARAHNWVQ
jgi:hypothetical protein